jgi:hypothetical protein
VDTSFRETGDYIHYLDVGEEHDLRTATQAGVLLALAGEALTPWAHPRLFKDPRTKPLKAAIDRVRYLARGRWVPDEGVGEPPDDSDDDPGEDGPHIFRPGVLSTPKAKGAQDRFADVIESLISIRETFPGPGKQVIFLFDSLDRLPDTKQFQQTIIADIQGLKEARIGVVVVGPVRFMVGADRAVADLFDETHFLPAHDPANKSELEFLKSVLRTRADQEFLPDESLELLAKGSGGMMRDLISLAKRAGQEAYTAGHHAVVPEDVARAIEAFGRSLAIGLDDEQVKTLKHLQRGKGFVIRGERELSLIETGRVVLHGTTSFSVHPALAPLLGAVEEAA